MIAPQYELYGLTLSDIHIPIPAIVEGHPRVLADPAPSVLLDRTGAEYALEIVVAFSTAEDETAAVKSDLIKGVDAALYAEHDKAGKRPSVGAVE